MKIAFFILTSLLLAVAAFVLAYTGKDGWGWFLFGSIITFVYPSKFKEE